MRGTLIQYNGYTLKSKIECAWAEYFDAKGFDWEYEPVKFRGRGCGVYTPDFRLNTYNIFVETKPYDGGKMNQFHYCTNPLLIIFGKPDRHYVLYKPANSIARESGHWNSFELALRYVVARPAWMESLP